MKRWRRRASSWLMDALGWIASRRRPLVEPEHLRRIDFPTQTRGRGMRFSEHLRDVLRPGWIRLRRDDRLS